MQEGSRIHRKIQKQMGPNYFAEVPLKIAVPISRDGFDFEIQVDGRCDGILINPWEEDDFQISIGDVHGNDESLDQDIKGIPRVIIDEIKGVYMDLTYLKEAIEVHKAQAMCYAYIYSKQEGLEEIGTRITYCNIESNAIKYFDDVHRFKDLESWFMDLINEYVCNAFQYSWNIKEMRVSKS